MSQKWYEVAVCKGNYQFITGMWANDLIEAKSISNVEWGLNYDCDAQVIDENGKQSMKSNGVNNKYHIGIVDDMLEKNEDMLTIDDLKNDSRLFIYDDFWVFTNQNDVEDVLHNYELDIAVNIYEWFLDDPWDLYPNVVEDEIKNSSFADRFEVNFMFADTLNNYTKEEMLTLDTEKVYVQVAKKNIIENLKREADKLEKEWAI